MALPSFSPAHNSRNSDNLKLLELCSLIFGKGRSGSPSAVAGAAAALQLRAKVAGSGAWGTQGTTAATPTGLLLREAAGSGAPLGSSCHGRSQLWLKPSGQSQRSHRIIQLGVFIGSSGGCVGRGATMGWSNGGCWGYRSGRCVFCVSSPRALLGVPWETKSSPKSILVI